MPSFAREIVDYSELIAICRDRAEELQISREEIDHVAGMARGHASKILGPKQVKRLGRISAPLLFQTLGVRLFILEDPAATARTLSMRNQRDDERARNAIGRPKEITNAPIS